MENNEKSKRNLDELIPESVEIGNNIEKKTMTENNEPILWLDPGCLVPDPDQPRKDFNEEALNELADSIKTHGMFQPILVTKTDAGYVLVAGERRWLAAKKAGIKEVPVIVKE